VNVPATNGDDTALPATLRDAWNWSRIRAHLEQLETRAELFTPNERRVSLEAGLAKTYRDLASQAAWLAAKHNASPKALQALAGYATAIRLIGQGTGPNAAQYRRNAQTSMLDAAGAVPCWIMSHARVSECMPADILSRQAPPVRRHCFWTCATRRAVLKKTLRFPCAELIFCLAIRHPPGVQL
jgi:hypothetical protein